MGRATPTCAVCHQRRTGGAYNDTGKVFICVQCQVDAKQFIEILDEWFAELDAIGPSTETDADEGF